VYDLLGSVTEAAAVFGEVAERLAGALDHDLQADRIGVDRPMSGPARLPDPLAEVARATARSARPAGTRSVSGRRSTGRTRRRHPLHRRG